MVVMNDDDNGDYNNDDYDDTKLYLEWTYSTFE